MPNVLGRQAVVIGAGISGLATAGALANHFERVTVLERDRLFHNPAHRPGTPQCRQLHGLLSGGLKALCQIFPGFDQSLAAAGAIPIRVNVDICEELPGFDPFPRRDFGGVVYAASRPLLEQTLRRRARAHRNVVIRDQCRVLELVPSDRRSITGVRCEGVDGSRELVAADLIVDASARGTLTLAALDAVGCARPHETTVGVDIGYATAAFEIPEPRPDWKAVFTFPSAPSSSRCGYLVPIEGNRWLVSITELRCPRPPRDLTEFLGAARLLRTRTIYDAIKHARPAGMPQRFGLAESSWRHYETVADLPRGLIPIGDAICRFNPVYAQGMSVAAKEASILADLLGQCTRGAGSLAGLTEEFLAEVQPWIAGAWSMSTTADLAYPQTRGERPADLEHTLHFGAALLRLAARDSEVHEVVVAIRHLARTDDVLHEPGLVERVRAEMAAASSSAAELAPLAA